MLLGMPKHFISSLTSPYNNNTVER